MPASTTVRGIVLSAMPVGEYDKRLVILTLEYGRITAFAKGARKPNSALLACSSPLAFGEFTLYVGRRSYSVISADIKNYFSELRADFDGFCYAMYFCEFCDYMTKENNDEKDILKLLYQTLRALTKKTIEFPLIKVVFELKMMTYNGMAPQVFHCVKCENNSYQKASEFASASGLSSPIYFSTKSGGILCSGCRINDKSSIRINTSTLYTMQYIISREIEKLYTFKVTSQVLNELEICMKHYLQCYIDHEFKSAEMLKTL